MNDIPFQTINWTSIEKGKTHAGNGLSYSSHYQLVKAWPQLPEGYVLGNPTGIGIDSGQNVFVFCRAGKKWPLLLPFPESPGIFSATEFRNSGKSQTDKATYSEVFQAG